MHVIAVGEQYTPSVVEWPDGTHYQYDVRGHWLHYLVQRPSAIETESIQTGSAQFALYIHDSVIFLLHQFGEMLWNDAPYSWWLVSDDERHLPDDGHGLHALLKVVLVDTSTGRVAALRALTFSAGFTRSLHKAIKTQSEAPWSLSRHEMIIRSVYARYSTEDLLCRSQIRCTGGE